MKLPGDLLDAAVSIAEIEILYEAGQLSREDAQTQIKPLLTAFLRGLTRVIAQELVKQAITKALTPEDVSE